MLNLGWPLTRRVIFSMDAETAHERTLGLLSAAPGALGGLASLTMGKPAPSLARDAFGVRLAGPVGLAAGLDKNGVAIPFWPTLGFGFVEVGTVTAHPQPGNPKPRMFRIPEDGAIINRMGFNNGGSEALAVRLRALRESGRWPTCPVGVNIGKSKITPLDEAPEDYRISARRVAELADYLTVNVSSPNTPGLRELQDRGPLEAILTAVLAEAGDTPVLVKLAPDLEPEAIAEVVDLAVELGLAGLIATNTTIGREGLTHDPGESGGLSGRPLWPLARQRIQVALDASAGRLPVVGVGGIHEAAQVADLLRAGCVAVQLYSSLIFEGPGLPSRIHRELARREISGGDLP
ncbi:MAG: quinone-dependent dihydroorotate dehydrogenase [Deltaproteobacteria bacterium]|nr:MAG: quinone-dependent dihydroorotate dehydrogenase [Deltaproteobacteria bacterium]